MKIHDISQEVFSCKVFPGDPAPERQVMLRIPDGAVCNLTAFRMCAHNGTHVDAPFHFLNDGRTIDRVDWPGSSDMPLLRSMKERSRRRTPGRSWRRPGRRTERPRSGSW